MNKSFKVLPAIALVLVSLFACVSPPDMAPDNTNDDLTAYANKAPSGLAIPDSTITPQIQANKIQDTEWGASVKALPKVQSKKATVLSYMGFDNDKGGYRGELPQIINFHELSGTSNIINMALQTDGADTRDGKRYIVTNNTDLNTIVSPYTSFKYERDSGDFRTLQAFVRWGFSTLPSQIKMLDIDSHGGAFLGAVKDDSSQHLISLPNIAKALRNAGTKLDILNFDACLMGSTEVLYELKDTADVIIGSEDSTLGTGMLYTKSLPDIIANGKNNEEIGRNIVLSVDRKGSKDFLVRPNKKGKIPQVYTISAYSTKYVNSFASELDNLSKLLLSKMSTQKAAIKAAINGSHPLYVDEDDLGGQRDIYEVLQRINTVVNDQAVKDQVSKVYQVLNKVILLSRANSMEKHAQGLAINIAPNSVQSNDYKATAFAKNTSWDELIIAVNQ